MARRNRKPRYVAVCRLPGGFQLEDRVYEVKGKKWEGHALRLPLRLDNEVTAVAPDGLEGEDRVPIARVSFGIHSLYLAADECRAIAQALGEVAKALDECERRASARETFDCGPWW